MVGVIDAATYEGIATTLFGHSQSVRTLVWSLKSKGFDHKIGWDEFIAFAEKDDHIPTTAEDWKKIVEVLAMLDVKLPDNLLEEPYGGSDQRPGRSGSVPQLNEESPLSPQRAATGTEQLAVDTLIEQNTSSPTGNDPKRKTASSPAQVQAETGQPAGGMGGFAFNLDLEEARATKYQRVLGEGGFADVFKGTYRFSGGRDESVAFKVFRHTKTLSSSQVQQIRLEASVGMQVEHRNLVRVFGILTLGEELSLMMELATDGSLRGALDGSDPITWLQRATWLQGVAEGLQFLHDHKPNAIIHRDLKADNVLLSGGVAKVADFGLAQVMTTIASTNIKSGSDKGLAGTMAWKAPETFAGKYSAGSDIFSWGVTAWEVTSRKRPYEGKAQHEVMRIAADRFKVSTKALQRGISEAEQVADWIEDNPLEERRPDLSLVETDCPKPLRDLLVNSWADEPSRRLSTADLAKHMKSIVDVLSGAGSAGNVYGELNMKLDEVISKLDDIKTQLLTVSGSISELRATDCC